jgi:hypothetical protein
MRGVLAVLTLAGCSFAGSGQPSDAALDATSRADGQVPTSDARSDAPSPTWQVVETLVIDSANPVAVQSALTLETGVVYRLRASGVITNVIDAFQGDADWVDFNSPRDNGCCEDIGLGIDDLVVDDLDTQPDWGPYDPTHVYQVNWTGEGAPITALFQDTYYDNNIGDLTLEILALQ